MNISQRQVVFAGNLVNAAAQPLVPNCNVLHLDATANDPRLATCHAGRDLNMFVDCFNDHESTLLIRTLPFYIMIIDHAGK
jgi:hypothetical protein